MLRLLGTVAALAVGLGCGPKASSLQGLTKMPPAVDAPYELASDSDLNEVRALYEAMPSGSAERAERRSMLAEEYARRIEGELESHDRDGAFENFRQLLGLWDSDELGDPGPELQPFADYAKRIRDEFARTGGDIEAVTALAALVLMDPDQADAYNREIDEIFAYSDSLAVSQYGDGAQRARPIKILEKTAEVLPSPMVVDRLVSLYVERQRALASLFKRTGPDIGLFQAHGESVLRTTWNIVRIFAVAQRLDEAAPAIADIHGIGDDADVRRRLDAALSGEDATAWVLLAALFRGDEGDPAAALAICREAIERFPEEPEGYFAAADTARAKNSIPLAISLYERGLELDADRAEASSSLADLYEFRVTTLAFNDRPNAAMQQLEEFEAFHEKATEILDEPPKPDLADAYAAMGRGLLSLGELDTATGYLERSLDLRPTHEAFQYLGTVALKQDRHGEAIRLLEKALSLPTDDPAAQYDRIVILRLAGEAYLASEKLGKGRAYLTGALRAWRDLGETHQLGRPFVAEALLEQGKIFWHLEERDTALEAFDTALDIDPGGASNYADIVAFLLVRGQYRHALDAYHRALGSREVGDYYKVYMSLWMVAEARRRGVDTDPFARDFLKTRDGRLWYDALARYATGESEAKGLAKLATTRGRRAELLYYTAVLETDADPDLRRRLLEGVVSSEMVLFFEYDMAKHWLSQGIAD